MRDLAIWADGLSKQYTLGQGRARHDTLRDHLVQAFGRLSRGTRPRDARTIWALREVSFDVKRGEVLGVIGRNGAGKSTLLKILSRITEPTRGVAEIRGRAASLLEVGTGFHPELTGRENIYLNGAILGMKKAEIDRQRDAIVAFSGVEQFIDTPVKRYSSGMYLRLAFSIAAHLRPEILLVDEVLAVGDADFQRKCLGKIGEVAREGRTVLFVSHNLGAIAHLCPRVLWIDNGRLQSDGPAEEVVAAYLQSTVRASAEWKNPDPAARRGFRFRSVRILSAERRTAAVVPFTSPFHIELGYELQVPLRDLSIIYRLTDAVGNIIWHSSDTDVSGRRATAIPAGHYRSVCAAPPHVLRPGAYTVHITAYSGHLWLCEHENVVTFEVSEVGYTLKSPRRGAITPLLPWETYAEEGPDGQGDAGRAVIGHGGYAVQPRASS